VIGVGRRTLRNGQLLGSAKGHRRIGVAVQRVRRLLRGTTRDLLVGIGLAAAVLLIALAVWPRASGVSGTISESICNPPATTMNCPPRPAAARVRTTDCYVGVLTSSKPRDNMTWDTRTDTNGRYHVDLEPGTYCIVASKEGSDPFPTTASQMSVTVRAGQVTTVDLTLGFPVGIGLSLVAPDTIATPVGPVLVSQLRSALVLKSPARDQEMLFSGKFGAAESPSAAFMGLKRGPVALLLARFAGRRTHSGTIGALSG